MIPESTSEFPLFNFINTSSIVLTVLVVFEYSPLTFKFPVIVTSPVIDVAPERATVPTPVDVILIGVKVVDPSLDFVVMESDLPWKVFAIVTSPDDLEISNESLPAVVPTINPAEPCTLSDQVVISFESALKKFPPAIVVEFVLVVEDTSTKFAAVVLPLNTAPLILEFKFNPGLIVVNPDTAGDGVNSALPDAIATLTFAAMIVDTT